MPNLTDRHALKARSLAHRRTKIGLSQQALAHRVGVTQSAISQWELGSVQPTTRHLSKLARALGVPIDELVKK